MMMMGLQWGPVELQRTVKLQSWCNQSVGEFDRVAPTHAPVLILQDAGVECPGVSLLLRFSSFTLAVSNAVTAGD